MSLWDLLHDIFISPFFEYYLHDLSVVRIVGRIISSLLFFAGGYIALARGGLLGWPLIVLATIITLVDLATLSLTARD